VEFGATVIMVQNSNCIVALPQQRNEILLQKVLEAVVARSLEPWPPCARAFILGRMAKGTFQRIVVGYLNDVKVSKPSSSARLAKSASRSPIPNSTKTSEGRQERPVSLLCANGMYDGERRNRAESTCAACSAYVQRCVATGLRCIRCITDASALSYTATGRAGV
jgi:hypothetical protein